MLTQANAILVVDECDPYNRAEIWNKVRNFSPRLKFVSIYNEIESISQVPQFIAPPLEEQEVIAIISEYIPAKDQARRWAEFCGGSPRVAHVVGNSLRHHPDDILRTPNTVNVWERYVTGADDPNSEAVRKRRLVLNHLALFQRFGFGAPHYDEAKSILGLIQKIEMTFTEAEFLEIINNQQKRKNLQGNVTLYLSPKLFHIWLWADWWNTYGPSFSWDAINDLPGKLKDWFLDMFEYAKESKAAETVVQELLSPGGPFDDLETLNNRRAAGFFFRLAKSKPGEALGALERAIEGKSSEDLLAFSEGRRDIIYSLEILAIYKEYFQRAAHILLLLAEAENETWGNNASGVFAELFSSGYGGVATSEASPLERLPALEEALFSPSPTTQMLGLKACDYALEAEHWARTIGNQSSGLKSEPERWTPKTYGEIWDGYRAVWNLLTTNLDRFGERERQYAIEVLLKRARGLIFRTKLWESVLEAIIYLSAKPYAPKRDLIQAVERILHHDQKKLPADVVHRLIDVRAKLVGNDYPSKLKRYAGMDLLEDRYNENGTESDDRQVVLVELAKQSVTTPDLLIPELNWLVTTEAENGYSFGYELGKTDIANALLERISHAQRMCQSNCSLLFLSGYGRSTYERDPLTWEKYIEGLAINGISAQWIPELLWRSGSVPERLIDLLNKLVEEKRVSPEHLGKFAYGTTRDHIKPETFLRWITLLMDDGTPASVGNALELFYSSQVRGKEKAESPFPSEHALRILTHPTWFQQKSKRRNQMDEYTWNEIGKTLIKRAPEKALILLGVLLEHFGSEDSIVESSFSEGIEVLGKIAEKFPREFWEQIKGKLGPPIDVRAFQLRHWLRGDLGDKQSPLPLVPPEMIWAWVDEDIQGRAWMLAGMVPKTWFKEEEGKVCLARQVLVRYGKQKNVRSELRNSFMSGTWWGPESSHFSGQKEFLLNIRKEDQDRNVRRWIDEYITDLSKYIDNARIREERGVF